MPFTFKLIMTGLVAYFPIRDAAGKLSNTDAVLINVRNHPTHPHDAVMKLGNSNIEYSPSSVQFPFTLDKHTIEIFDGDTAIPQASNLSPEHAFPKYPDLSTIGLTETNLKTGVRTSQTSIATQCAARVQLRGGTITADTASETIKPWALGLENLTPNSSNYLTGSEQTLIRRFIYERSISSNTVKLVLTQPGSQTINLVLKPYNGQVVILLENLETTQPDLNVGYNVALDFKAVYELFDNNPSVKYILRDQYPRTAGEITGAGNKHPCVAGYLNLS